jgi:hypothetical protein
MWTSVSPCGEVNLKTRVADISRRRIARSMIGINDPSGMFEVAPRAGAYTRPLLSST